MLGHYCRLKASSKHKPQHSCLLSEVRKIPRAPHLPKNLTLIFSKHVEFRYETCTVYICMKCVCQPLFQRGFTFHSQGDHPCVVSDGPTKRPQHMRISRLITVTYLRTRCEQIAHCLPMISQAFAGCPGSS